MCRFSVIVMAVPDDHDPIVVMAMPAVIVMHFRTRVETVVMSDHHVSALAIDGAAMAIVPSAAITYPSFFISSSSF